MVWCAQFRFYSMHFTHRLCVVPENSINRWFANFFFQRIFTIQIELFDGCNECFISFFFLINDVHAFICIDAEYFNFNWLIISLCSMWFLPHFLCHPCLTICTIRSWNDLFLINSIIVHSYSSRAWIFFSICVYSKVLQRWTYAKVYLF